MPLYIEENMLEIDICLMWDSLMERPFWAIVQYA